MFRNIFISIILISVGFVVLGGCDEDDCAECPQINTPGLFVDGIIALNERVGLSLRARPFDGRLYPDIDSAKLDDTLCDINISQYWGYGDYVAYVGFNELPTDNPMYSSGDTVTISVYHGSRSSHCDIVLMDRVFDALAITAPSVDTAVNPLATLSLFWTDIPLAQWYAIEIEKTRDSAGQDVTTLHYLYTRDTTFTLAEEFTATEVRLLYITVIPVTGPDPESDKGNFSGDLVGGWVYCYGGFDEILITILDTSKRTPNSSPTERTHRSPEEIISAVYKAYH